jgi:plasmid stability protein
VDQRSFVVSDLAIDLPQSVIDRLERQATANGRALNDEVLAILSAATEVAPSPHVPFAAAVAAAMREAGLTEEASDAFDAAMTDIRVSRYDSIHRDAFAGFFDDDDVEPESPK